MTPKTNGNVSNTHLIGERDLQNPFPFAFCTIWYELVAWGRFLVCQSYAKILWPRWSYTSVLLLHPSSIQHKTQLFIGMLSIVCWINERYARMRWFPLAKLVVYQYWPSFFKTYMHSCPMYCKHLSPWFEPWRFDVAKCPNPTGLGSKLTCI